MSSVYSGTDIAEWVVGGVPLPGEIMTKIEADILVAKLDNLEARARDVEAGMTRIRHELQDQFTIKMWDYDPARSAHNETK